MARLLLARLFLPAGDVAAAAIVVLILLVEGNKRLERTSAGCCCGIPKERQREETTHLDQMAALTVMKAAVGIPAACVAVIT